MPSRQRRKIARRDIESCQSFPHSLCRRNAPRRWKPGLSVSGDTLTATAIFISNVKLCSMAKVYESEIDPDEFIRSFREEPSALSSLKNKPPDGNTESKPPVNNAKVKRTKEVSPVSDDVLEDYRERFVLDKAYLRPRLRFMMVEINPDFIRKIKRIISYECDSPCSIKSYVNNVLADHFERYKEIIEKRL